MSNSRPGRRRRSVDTPILRTHLTEQVAYQAARRVFRERAERQREIARAAARAMHPANDGTSGTSGTTDSRKWVRVSQNLEVKAPRPKGRPLTARMRSTKYRRQNGGILHRPLHSRGTLKRNGHPNEDVTAWIDAEQSYSSVTGPQQRRILHKHNHNSKAASWHRRESSRRRMSARAAAAIRRDGYIARMFGSSNRVMTAISLAAGCAGVFGYCALVDALGRWSNRGKRRSAHRSAVASALINWD